MQCYRANEAARHRILELSLDDMPLTTDLSLDDLTNRLDGYSGADIVNICKKACAIPFVEGVQTGTEREVVWDDFETVLEKVRPSVTTRDLNKFEKFRLGE